MITKKKRLYHKLRHLFIAYIDKLHTVLKNKYILNTILTYYQKIQLYYVIISDNTVLTCSVIFVENLDNGNANDNDNDNGDMISLLQSHFEMLHYEITSKLNFAMTGPKLAEDILDSTCNLVI